jgi:hypothetical protein
MWEANTPDCRMLRHEQRAGGVTNCFSLTPKALTWISSRRALALVLFCSQENTPMRKLSKRTITSRAIGKLSRCSITPASGAPKIHPLDQLPEINEAQKLPNEPKSEQPPVESECYPTTSSADSHWSKATADPRVPPTEQAVWFQQAPQVSPPQSPAVPPPWANARIIEFPNEPKSEQPAVESERYLTTSIADFQQNKTGADPAYPRNQRFRFNRHCRLRPHSHRRSRHPQPTQNHRYQTQIPQATHASNWGADFAEVFRFIVMSLPN